LKPGQLITGRNKLAKETGLTVQSVRTSLTRLKSTREITMSPKGQYSIITINNWHKYQLDNQQANQVLTNFQPCPNHIQECKEYKNIYNLVETNVSTPEEKPDKITDRTPYRDFVDNFNKICSKLPKTQKITEARKKKIKSRWKENPKMEYWCNVFEILNNSGFHTGENNRGWKADIDWLIRNDTNHVKLLEKNQNKKSVTSIQKKLDDLEHQINEAQYKNQDILMEKLKKEYADLKKTIEPANNTPANPKKVSYTKTFSF
jgi:hypothetical protein